MDLSEYFSVCPLCFTPFTESVVGYVLPCPCNKTVCIPCLNRLCQDDPLVCPFDKTKHPLKSLSRRHLISSTPASEEEPSTESARCSSIRGVQAASLDKTDPREVASGEAEVQQDSHIKTKIARWRERSDELRSAGERMSAYTAVLERNKEVCEEQIHSAFAEIQRALAARKEELLSSLSELHKEKLFAFVAHQERMSDLASTLDRACADAKHLMTTEKHATMEKDLALRTEDAMDENLHLNPKESPLIAFAIMDKSAKAAISKLGEILQETPKIPIPSQPFKGESVRSWGYKGRATRAFNIPTGIAIHNTLAFVSDKDNHRVSVFDASTGNYLQQIGTGKPSDADGLFHHPWGLAVSLLGELFVSDHSNHRIQVFSVPSCAFLRKFGTEGAARSELIHPRGIALSANCAELFVCDSGNHRVQVFLAIDGTFMRSWGSSGEKPGCFQKTMEAIAISPESGGVFVSDYGDEMTSTHRIQVFTPSGQLLLVLGGAVGCGDHRFNVPAGLAFTGVGTLLVCDWGNHRVLELRMPDCAVVREWGQLGSDPGQFLNPQGVAVGENGEVLVCEQFGNRVQVFA